MCILTGIGAAIASAVVGSTLTATAGAATSVAAGTISTALAGTLGSLAVGGLVAGVAGTALGAVGSYQAGRAQSMAYEQQAKVARQNSIIAQNNAAMERQSGTEEARRKRISTLQNIGSQKTALAANGVDVGYGTSLDVIEDTAMVGELDALMIETDSERKARNYEIESNNLVNEANLSSFSSRNARTAGTIGAISKGTQAIGQLGSSLVSFGGMGFGGLGSTNL